MRNSLHTITIALLFCFAGIASWAQAPAPIVPESLLIGPGDQLRVTVFDVPELTQDLRVDDNGNAALSLGGIVQLSGLTSTQAAHKIEVILRSQNYIKEPHVQVSITEYVAQKVPVLGEVKNPGSYSLQTPRPVLSVLTLAGGLTETADRRIQIQRGTTSTKVSYFLSNNASETFDTGVLVYPGDTVFVPKAGIVYILGDVRLPGGYTMTDNRGKLSALELVARAGGINTTSKASKTHLMRKTDKGYTETPVNFGDLERGKIPDFDLVDGDIIWVPFSYTKNFALGASSIVSAVGGAALYRF
jgi:polysaccharide export outer membrane protein